MNNSFPFLCAAARAPSLALCFCAASLLASLACAQPELAAAPDGEPAAAAAVPDAMDAPATRPAPAPIRLPELLLKDSAYVLGAPARWEQQDWRRAAWISGAVLGAGLLLDRPLRDASQRNPRSGLGRLSRRFEPLGSTAGSALLLAGFYGYGLLSDDPRAIDVAQDGLAASLIASGLIAPALRLVVGRSRPREDLGSGHFQPFSARGTSFPSGHSTQAFTLATVIAMHYSEVEWVPYAAYGAASLVGVSRVYRNAHFTSDVLAGAAIGILVGRGVVGFNSRRADGRGYTVMPAVTGRGLGLALDASF